MYSSTLLFSYDNNRPCNFDLLGEELVTVTVTESNVGTDSLIITWEPSFDPDNDSLFYSWELVDLDSGYVITSVEDLEDTTLVLQYSDIFNLLAALSVDSITLGWDPSIIATQLFVVPKSIPITLPIFMFLLLTCS